uniref:Uncharacterized protein n=1 Tax=Daucus carota subsp. sativus TaxID=79200 RepID=A0A166AT20_DAUCS
MAEADDVFLGSCPVRARFLNSVTEFAKLLRIMTMIHQRVCTSMLLINEQSGTLYGWEGTRSHQQGGSAIKFF